MFLAWIVYIVVLAVWGTLSFIAIRHVLHYDQPGLGTHKIIFVYFIFAGIIIVSSLITMLTIDWDYLIF